MSRRVALIAYACEPDRGTEPGVGWQWARHLAAAGHDVELITRTDALALPRLQSALSTLERTSRPRLHAIPEPTPAHWEGLPIPASVKAGWTTARRYLGWLAAVESYLTSVPAVEVIHHVTWGSLSGGSVQTSGDPRLMFGPVSGGQRAPRVLRPLLGSSRGQESLRDAFASIALRRPGRARRTVAEADLILATNSDTARVATARGAHRVEMMLADGITNDYLATEVPDRDLINPTVLWVGSLRPIKIPSLAIAAFRHVVDLLPSARLHLIGDGPLYSQVERECERLGIRDAVRLIGKVPWSDLKQEYDKAAVLLFTSVRDAFGAQSLEAWARALPSVGFAQHGLADFAPPEASVLVPPSPPPIAAQQLAQAILSVIRDPERHRHMSHAALQGARLHTWDCKVSRASLLYEEICGSPARRGATP